MTTMPFRSPQSRQRGATLLVALIMLIVMTLVALSSFNLGQSNLQIVGNAQYRSETLTAANMAIQEVISNPEYANYATKPFADIAGKVKTYDVDGDGNKNISVTVKATCVRVRPLPNDELDLTTKEKDCLSSPPGAVTGVVGALTGDSMCGEVLWDVSAAAGDTSVGANSTVAEGVVVRMLDKNQLPTYCP